MDSISRIKEYIKENFSNWVKIDYSEFDEKSISEKIGVNFTK